MSHQPYTPCDTGTEVQAPWGYYQALGEGSLEYAGKRVVYTLGSACIEASCCGKGSWDYARVEGYEVEGGCAPVSGGDAGGGPGSSPLEIDTIEASQDKAAIAKLLLQKHPGVRVEFR
jgi:hypothetical protein